MSHPAVQWLHRFPDFYSPDNDTGWHRKIPQPGNPACAAVQDPLMGGGGGAGQDELAFPRVLINLCSSQEKVDFQCFIEL